MQPAGKASRYHVIFSVHKHIVLARCTGSNGMPFVLETLCPGDTGQTWPDADMELPLVMHRSLRPYRCELSAWWAQRHAAHTTRVL